MSGKISVDPNRLDELANQFVFKLNDIEEESKRLHIELANLILSAPRSTVIAFILSVIHGEQVKL
ncbi:hypothetical protein MGI18_03445 [Bacillus sp. OVS6]|nr:hypothetical protein MGI18_03445 [Bacillus sp. OVS6]